MKRKTRSSLKTDSSALTPNVLTEVPKETNVNEIEDIEEIGTGENCDKAEDNVRKEENVTEEDYVKNENENVERKDNCDEKNVSKGKDVPEEDPFVSLTFSKKTDDKVIDETMEEDDPSVVDSDEIKGVIENPLFEPAEGSEAVHVEKFSMDALEEDDLDFEPDIEESQTKTNEKKNISRMENVASPNKLNENKDVVEDEDELEVIDEVIISDTEDIDKLGDKIDAAYPGKQTNPMDDDESDEEKRCWRSEKQKAKSESTSGRREQASVRRRRVSPPGPSRHRHRSRLVQARSKH